jgi:glycogen synthase kinase 3 beta
VYQDRRFKNRELQIMRTIKHPNIVELKNYYFSTSSNKDIYLNMLLEYVPDSLFQASHGYLDKQSEVPLSVVKLYMYQLLRALAYIHSKKICHRDIKPQNVLVNAVNGDCKLCDFGSAKQLIPGEENIAYICSRYYRAPELVFGATIYTTAIDVWSVGCVMGEMIIGHPLFAGETGVDQLVEIIKILGTPTKDQINLMNPNYKEMKFPQVKGSSLHKCFKTKTSLEAIDLLEKMLQYSPKDRITAAEAMCHPFFEDLVRRTLDLPLSMALPDVCNWLPGELDTFPKDVRNTLDSFRMRPT